MSPEQIGAADIPTPVLDLDAADMKAESERYAAEVHRRDSYSVPHL